MFCHWYPTRLNKERRGQRSLIRKGGNQIVRGGREPGWDGMVNICEPLLNVVTSNKPKMLTDLNQKVRGQVQVL
jgi:hypothetical protein